MFILIITRGEREGREGRGRVGRGEGGLGGEREGVEGRDIKAELVSLYY